MNYVNCWNCFRVTAMDRTYKIVQTNDNGKVTLSAVPTHWEYDGKLFWPPSAMLKLAYQTLAMPDENDGWTVMDCVLKRQNIPTYKGALKEMSVMCNNSDTDETSTTTSKSNRRHAQNNADKTRVDHNKEFVRADCRMN